jgi:hypothetical protein
MLGDSESLIRRCMIRRCASTEIIPTATIATANQRISRLSSVGLSAATQSSISNPSNRTIRRPSGGVVGSNPLRRPIQPKPSWPRWAHQIPLSCAVGQLRKCGIASSVVQRSPASPRRRRSMRSPAKCQVASGPLGRSPRSCPLRRLWRWRSPPAYRRDLSAGR